MLNNETYIFDLNIYLVFIVSLFASFFVFVCNVTTICACVGSYCSFIVLGCGYINNIYVANMHSEIVTYRRCVETCIVCVCFFLLLAAVRAFD